MLEALTALYAAKQNKPRWAEKTPDHLLYLPRVRMYYPDAPIVRIVRDPRDCALSMRKLPGASHSVLANSYLWAAWFSKSQPFFERDPETFTLRYEDLIAEPEPTLRRLCTFVGEAFEVGMLETQKTGVGVSSPNETWKASNAQALDYSQTRVWTRELDAATQKAVSYSCLAGLEAFGYPIAHLPDRTLRAYLLSVKSAELHEAALFRAASRGVRVEHSSRPLRESELLLLPGTSGSLRRQLGQLLKLGTLLTLCRLRGRPARYLHPERPAITWSGRTALTLSHLLGKRYSG